ncbi:MAG TPA: GNAT family N-acetyltransferase [Allosphingosinicella sp.]
MEIRGAVGENRLSDPDMVRRADYVPYVGDQSCWVWEEGDSILGFSALDAANGSLWALFVEPEASGRGVGRALLDKAVAYARTRRLEQISLTTSPGSRAEGVYRAAGWRSAGRAQSGDLILVLSLWPNTIGR